MLVGHRVFTAEEMLWDTLRNGNLLAAAEAEGFEVMITADTKMKKQQSHIERKIALLVLTPNRWAVIQQNAPAILEALARVEPGGHELLVMMENGVPAQAKARWSRR